MAIAVAVVATRGLHGRRGPLAGAARSPAATTSREPDPCLGETLRPQAVGRVREHRERRRLARRRAARRGRAAHRRRELRRRRHAPSSTRRRASARSRARSAAADFEAALTRDPPPPGPRPRAPDSIAGEYVLKPRSACLGATLAIEGSGPDVRAGPRRDASSGASSTRTARSPARPSAPTARRPSIEGEGGRPHHHADGRRGPA